MSERRNFNIRREIRKYGSDILKSENFRSSAGNIQHSNVSVMKHSMKVAYTSMWICEKFKIKCNRQDLVRGALLHDYFLYDWHVHGDKLHGYHHPHIALKNAGRDFGLTRKEKNIIKSHMWPLTLTHIPKSKEAMLVCIADKICSVEETLKKDREKLKELHILR